MAGHRRQDLPSAHRGGFPAPGHADRSRDTAAEFTLGEPVIADLADRYEIATDHDALLVLEAAIHGHHSSGRSIVRGPCEVTVELLADADADLDGYRILLRHGPGRDSPWLASDVRRAADHLEAGMDTRDIIRDFLKTANGLYAWHQDHVTPAGRAGGDRAALGNADDTGPELG